MDFVSDQLFDGRRFRALTLVDNYSRECLEIEVGQNLKGFDVVAVMGTNQSIARGGATTNSGRQRKRVHLEGVRQVGL